MGRLSTPEVEENVACNLIPMIDIMFLLLLFFMLGADMTQREFEDVVLPVADQAKEQTKEKGEEGTVTVNVYHRQPSHGFSCPVHENKGICRDESHWLVSIHGRDYTLDTVGSRLELEAKEELEEGPTGAGGKPFSKRIMHIRADAKAPFGYVQRVIEAASFQGIYKIEIAASKPAPAGPTSK